MRCCACDRVLNEFELTLKLHSGHFADMCRTCYSVSFADEDDYADIGINNENDMQDIVNMLNAFEDHRYE